MNLYLSDELIDRIAATEAGKTFGVEATAMQYLLQSLSKVEAANDIDAVVEKAMLEMGRLAVGTVFTPLSWVPKDCDERVKAHLIGDLFAAVRADDRFVESREPENNYPVFTAV
jgi:hypothetical protein